MQRILLLITDLEIGGTPAVVRELALRLHRAGGAHIEVACLGPWGPVADQIAAGGVTVTALKARSTISLPIVVTRLARLIRREHFDTVFSFLLHANASAALACLFCPGVRLLQSIQTTQPSPAWHWRMQRWAHPRADRLVVPSPSVADVAARWSAVPADKLRVISNAVDVVGDQPPKDRRVSPSSWHVGFIGRLDPIKRIPNLINAMTHLPEDVHLHIYGQGAEQSRIEQEISRLDLGSRVTLHGAIAGPESALARIDLLVLPSQAEGFGLVLIEAMAAGVPVVATDVPGIRDVIRNGETGLLMPSAEPEQIADTIKTALGDEALRQRLINAAWADVKARFSWEAALPAYQALLKVNSDE